MGASWCLALQPPMWCVGDAGEPHRGAAPQTESQFTDNIEYR